MEAPGHTTRGGGAALSSGPAATDIARGGALPAGYCDGTSRVAISHEIPQDTPDPGQVYALGLRGANQRVISSSGNSGSLTLDSFGQHAGQRWQLEPDGDGGYRIRSDADLDRCVEQSTATIVKQPCGTAAAQRWTLVPSADDQDRRANTTSDSVGVSSETKLAVAKVLKVVLTAYYKHTWTDTTTDSKAYTVDVPPGYYGWMERSMTMQDVRAEYVVTAGNQTYEIPSVTVSAPAAGNPAGGVAVARAVPIPASSGACNDRSTGGLLPMPAAPRVGKSYSIGIGTANQRVITAGSSPLRVTSYAAGTTGQQWEFTEPPGHEGHFQIRSVASSPDKCLANDVATKTLTTSDCQSGVATQRWSVELDPATSSYKPVSAENGRQPEAASTAVDAVIAMSASPNTALGRWEFRVTG